MVKVCLEEFPAGSYKKQQGDGFYMDGLLKKNLDLFVKNITRDMQFVGLISGDGTVGNGKSTLAQQQGFYYSREISKKTGKDIPFTINNVVFNAKELIEKAFTLPQYSCIILDEGDDLTAHYFSKLRQTLNRFFRKCRQLNLFIILILPDFFEMPKHFAIVRSNYLCNVKFAGEFERGFYDFYGPRNKKWLYLKGKKELDYQPFGVHSDFHGRFVKLYTVDEKLYREGKQKDAEEDEKQEKSIQTVQFEAKAMLVGNFVKNSKDMTKKEIFKRLGIGQSTGEGYLSHYNTVHRGVSPSPIPLPKIKVPIVKG